MTFVPGTPPAAAATDDHVLATWLATVAGERLLEVRSEGLEGRELKDAGDQAAHDLLMGLLAEHRPDDAVLSEEGKDDKARLDASRVWIVDPLDGTREFSEPPRDDWAVHVALWQDGDLVAGAVAQPALGETFNTGEPSVVPPSSAPRPRIAVSRSRPPEFVNVLAQEIDAGGPDGLGRGEGDVRRPRHHRRLRARRRPVRVGLGCPGRGGPRGRPLHVADRRDAAVYNQDGLPARPDRLPARARRADRGIREEPRLYVRG